MLVLASLVVIAVLFAGLELFAKMPSWMRYAYLALLALGIAAFSRGTIADVEANVAHPPRWDFLCFWLDGRVALLDHNVYLPAYFHARGDALNEAADFTREFLDVGFLYPPPSIVWFAPLGLIANVHAALALWYVFILACAAAVVYLLWSTFLRAYGAVGLLAAATLVVVFPATHQTLQVTQTMFLAVLFVLLFWRERVPWRAGVWIGLAATVKPFLIVLLVYPLVTRAWRTVVAAAATVGALALVALAILGPSTFVTYVRANPVARVPGWIYTETSNQSLLGWILRLTHRAPEHVAVLREPVYLIIACVLAAATLALCARIARVDRETAIVLSLLLGLLVYPQTLFFYALVLLIPIATLWKRSASLPGATLAASLFAAAIVALLAYRSGALTSVAIALVWLVFAAIALRTEPKAGGQTEVPFPAPGRRRARATSVSADL